MKNPPKGVWYKSSRSDGASACLEVCHSPGTTLIRDTKDVGRGPILEFPADVWSAFIASGIWQR